MNSLTGKDNQFFKLAFWMLGLGAAWMWLPIKDTLLNLLSVVMGLVFVFAIADSVLIMLGAISDPAQGIQARIANWLESMKSTPVVAPAPQPIDTDTVTVARAARQKAFDENEARIAAEQKANPPTVKPNPEVIVRRQATA